MEPQFRQTEVQGRAGFMVERAGEPPTFLTLLRSEDEWRIRRGLEELSPNTRYLRFFSPATTFSDAEVRVMSSPDQVRHVAWVALAPTEEGCPGVGLGRFVQDAEGDAAELAIVVIDRMHRRGIGSVLLGCLLASAARRGIARLRASVLWSNHGTLEWLESWGGERRVGADCCEVHVSVRGGYGARAALAEGVGRAANEVEDRLSP